MQDVIAAASKGWQKAVIVNIEQSKRYLVKTNGGEWRYPDLYLMTGYEVLNKLRPEYVRGRPVYVAEVFNIGEPLEQ